MSLGLALAKEFKAESRSLQKMLERFPDESADWKPHEKSSSLLALTRHIVTLPRWVEPIFDIPKFDFERDGVPRSKAGNRDDLIVEFQKNGLNFLQKLDGISDDFLQARWHFSLPFGEPRNMARVNALRSFIFSHMIHHRGQMSVYFRLLNVPVPFIYGPTADER